MWTEIKHNDQFQHLLDLAHGFHDAVARVACLDTGVYVDRNYQMIEKGLGRLWLRIQTQWVDTPVVDMVFLGVSSVSFAWIKDRSAQLEFEDGVLHLTLGSWRISSERMLFRVQPASELGEIKLDHLESAIKAATG